MRVSGGGGGVVAAAAASTAPASAGTEAECRYVDEVSRHGGRPHCGLRAILRTNPTQLCAISLRHTYVGDAGVVALMKAVPQLPNLVVMDLRENGLSNAACRSIEVGCLACRQLVLLDVSSNPLVTRKGGLHLHSLMTRSPTLLHVNVTGTLVSRYYETRLRACHKRRMDERFDASSAATRRLWEHVAATRDYSDFLQPHNRAQVLRRYGVATSSAVAVAAAPAAPAATPQPPLVPRPPPQPPSSSAVAVLTKHNSLEVFFARGGGAASSASSAAADTRADAAGATVEEKGGVDAAAGAAAAAALWDKSERPLSLKRQHRARLELAAAAAVAAASAVAAVAALPQGSDDSDAAAAAAPPAARSAACGSAFLAGVASVTNMPHDEVWTLAPRSEDECRSATTSPAPLAPPAAAAPALAPHPPSAPPPQGRVSHYTSADFEGAGEEGLLQRQQQQQALAASAGSSGTEATEEEEEEEGVLPSEDDDDDDDDDEATTTTTEGECSSDGRSSSSSQGAHRAQHSSSLAPGPMLLRGDPNTPLFRTTESDLSCAHGESLISDLYCASGGDASVAAATATTTTTTSTAAPSVAAASGGGTSTSTSTSTAPPRRPSVPPATPGLLAELGELGAAAQLRKEQQQAGHSPCWKPPSDEVAGLFSYIAAYKPTEQAIDAPFKFPGKLSYIPAVGAPDACLQPAPPADIPSPPEAAVGSSCMFWTYMMTADPAALADKGCGGAAAAAAAADRQPPNPHDDPEAALQALQRRIYYANIAPPAVYDQPIASLMEEAGPPLPAFPFLGSEDGEAAATATAVGSEVEDEAAAVATTPDAAAASAAAAAAAAETPANGAEAGGGAKVEAAAAEEAAVVEAEEEDEDDDDDDDDDDEPAVPLAQFDGWHLASDLRCFNTVSAVSAVRRCAPSDAAEVPAAAADGEEGTAGRLVCRDPAREMTAEELSRDALERYLTAASLQINTVRPYASGEQTPDYKGAYHLHAVVRASSGGLSRAARLTSGALNKTGSRLATGSYDLTAKIWDAESGGLLKSLVGHEGYVYDVIWNVPFCDRLVTASFDRTCKVWEASTGECLHTLVGHEQEVVCICINGESTLIASGSMDTTVIVWNALSGTQIAMLQGHTAEIVCVDFSPTNEMLVSGSADETMRVWHALTGELVAVLAGHHGEVSAVRFNVHGNLILSCSSDTTCRLWDVATRKAKSLKGHSKDVSDCDFSSDGWLVASGSEDMSARVWDTLSGGCISMMKGHTAGICCVSFGASGRELLTGSADMTCRRWRVSTGECLQVLAGHRGVVISSYCLDNSTVLTISKDNTCRLWRRDPPNRSLVQYVMQFVCLKPVMKAQLLQDPRVPQHLKKLAREVEERLADVIAPAVVPTVLYHH